MRKGIERIMFNGSAIGYRVFEAASGFYFGWGTGRWAIILWGLDTFLIFPNFVGSSVLSRLATREATRIPHVYK